MSDRIQEWKQAEPKPIWRYVVTAVAVVFSFPFSFLCMWAFITVSLTGQTGGGEAANLTGVELIVMRIVHAVNMGLIVLFYSLIWRFVRELEWTWKHWALLSISFIPFLFYLFGVA